MFTSMFFKTFYYRRSQRATSNSVVFDCEPLIARIRLRSVGLEKVVSDLDLWFYDLKILSRH